MAQRQQQTNKRYQRRQPPYAAIRPTAQPGSAARAQRPAQTHDKQRRAKQRIWHAILRQPSLKKESQQRCPRTHNRIDADQPQRLPALAKKAHALSQACCHALASRRMHLLCRSIAQPQCDGKRKKPQQNIRSIGAPIAQGQRQPRAQRRAGIDHAVNPHIRSRIAIIFGRASGRFQAVIGQRFARAGGKIVSQSAEYHGDHDVGQRAAQQHQQRRNQAACLAQQQDALAAEYIRHHPGGNFKQQARQVKRTLGQTDFHQRIAARRQQRHPGGRSQLHGVQPSMQIQAANLRGHRNFRHKKAPFHVLLQ